MGCSNLDVDSKKYLKADEQNDRLKTEEYGVDNAIALNQDLLHHFVASKSYRWVYSVLLDQIQDYDDAEKLCHNVGYSLPTREQIQNEGARVINATVTDRPLEEQSYILDEKHPPNVAYLICVTKD